MSRRRMRSRITMTARFPSEMTDLSVLDLFAGIGGFSLGLERASLNGRSFRTVAFCEIEPFPRAVLRKHWPDVRQYEDVRTLTADQLVRDGIGRVDVITGGFPCQDLSATGAQAGIGEDTRSGLFRQIIRLAVECSSVGWRPYLIFENVGRLLSGPAESPGAWFGEFLNSLAEVGYDAEWFSITAASIGAPHERDRVWIVAYPNTSQLERGSISCGVYQEHANFSDSCWGQDKPGVVRTSNGIPSQMDRVASLGNSVVPQIPEMIGRAILLAQSQ